MIGIIIMGVTALLLGILIVVIDKRLNKEDERVVIIERLLPGYNCGACGFGSCRGMALKILENMENYQKCRPLKKENKEKLVDYCKKENIE